MRILLTNDDGITSPGLWAAARGAARVGHLTVIGTTSDWSACGAAVMLKAGTRLKKYETVPTELNGLDHVEAYSIEAPPGAAVIAGLMSGLFEPFDLVISGVNQGLNVGLDLSHSGTLGAGIAAFGRGKNAFAVSIDRGYPQHWDTATDVVERLARWYEGRTGDPLLLNLNVPNRPASQIQGVSNVHPVNWGNLDRSTLRVESDPLGGWTVRGWIDRSRPYPDESNTDSGAVAEGKIAVMKITPVWGAPVAASEETDGLLAAFTTEPAQPSLI
ncbi:MAG: 5'/3'-nucleotidase SurE [Chloroflexota bacterium]